MSKKLFKDLKVVELASVLAGPAVGMFFAELGAEVLKIENKRTDGDVTRRWKLPAEDAELPDSAYYHSINWGKRVLLLDLREEADREEAYRHISEADVVISNFRPAAARRLGMDAGTLRGRYPALIHAQLTAFDEEQAERPAFDVVLQAESGFLYMSGEPGRDPVKMPVALIDLLAAHQLKEGILLALLKRERTGRGSYVRTSLLEAALVSLANQATNWLMGGVVPQRTGCRHPNIAPYGDIFTTSDEKQVVIAVGTEAQFQSLCSCLELEHLSDDERFATNAARVRHREALLAALAPAFQQYDRAALMARLLAEQVPVGSIRDLSEVFALPTAQRMILEGPVANGRLTRRVRTVAFHLE